MGITKKVLSVRVDEELIAELKALAKLQNRPLSNYIETLLKNHVKDIKQ